MFYQYDSGCAPLHTQTATDANATLLTSRNNERFMLEVTECASRGYPSKTRVVELPGMTQSVFQVAAKLAAETNILDVRPENIKRLRSLLGLDS